MSSSSVNLSGHPVIQTGHRVILSGHRVMAAALGFLRVAAFA
jgi:hypothetical protein